MRKRILVIEHAPKRALGVAETIHQSHPETEVIVAKVYQGEKLPDLHGFDGIIPGGGPMGIYEFDKPENAFLLPELEYLSLAVEAGVPILAICLGHQIIAYLLGGAVVRDETRKEIGWTSIQLNEDDKKSPIFNSMDSQFNLFEYHNDHIVKIPDGSRTLAGSEKSPVQALEYDGKPIWSVQFHPEISTDLGAVILNSTRDKLETAGEDVDFLLSLAKCSSESARTTIFKNFLNIINRGR